MYRLNNPPTSPTPGLFVVFEGLDGSGKSTQCKQLASALEAAGHCVVQTREPTQGPWGQKIRNMARSGQRVSAEEELSWFMEDRKEHVAQVILPALQQGHVVIQDRYYLSTAAYQGSRGLDVQEILDSHQTFAPLPHLTFLLAIPASVGLERVQQSRGDTPDAFETLSSLQGCADVFHNLDYPNLKELDGQLPPHALHQQILQLVLHHLK